MVVRPGTFPLIKDDSPLASPPPGVPFGPGEGAGGEGRLLVLLLAVALDLAFGEPPDILHPVVGLGSFIAALRCRAPRRGRLAQLAYGAAIVAASVGSAAGLALLADRCAARLAPAPGLLAAAVLLKPSFAVRALLRAAEQVRAPVEAGDLPAARAALRSLVSRDPSQLDFPLIVAAAVESLAENAGDSAIAPWLAYLVGGLPGAYAYRAANTLDAMIGYHGEDEYLGRCAARLDDLLNLVPSRLAALVVALGAALSGQDAPGALAIPWRDHRRTASPNAGWPMSAMAGALNVQLEKVGHYRLGDPVRPIEPPDVARAARIVTRGLAALLAAILVARLAPAAFQ